MATDYYGVLGLSKGASDTEIKRAYRKLARDLHPDVNPEPGAKDQFQEVSRAYEALTDPEKRRIIDLGGDPYRPAAAAGATRSAAVPVSAASATSWTPSSAARAGPAGRAAAPARARTR